MEVQVGEVFWFYDTWRSGEWIAFTVCKDGALLRFSSDTDCGWISTGNNLGDAFASVRLDAEEGFTAAVYATKLQLRVYNVPPV